MDVVPLAQFINYFQEKSAHSSQDLAFAMLKNDIFVEKDSDYEPTST